MKMLFLLPKMSQVQQLDPLKTKNKKYCRPSPATWPNEKKMNNYCKPSPATWPNENKEQKVLQAKSSNLTYNRFCYKIRNFKENVVFVTNNEPSPATWPNENKKIKKYCRPSPATWPTIGFVTKLETLMKMLLLFSTKRQVQQLDPMKKGWTIIASQVQQLDPMKTKNKKVLQAKSSNLTYNRFCHKIRNFNENVVFDFSNAPSPATWPNEKRMNNYCKPSPAT